VIEFLLTSHPLDCPICDKGGECPLQNLTMEHGPGVSRFEWADKMHLGKHLPLSELIYLDQERCIQCARCTRFCTELVDDHVIAFHQRGRKLQIVSASNPPFDSYFSGNTTDICPVGALTTADFHFGARPWEMIQVATICSHCPVGCNMAYSTRSEAETGRVVIKRVMPRQNESVNEIWICDKGRFAHHFADHPDRLTSPLMRKEGELVEVGWDEALETIATMLKTADSDVAGIAGSRLSNEDLYAFQKLIRGLGSPHVMHYPAHMGGGEFVAQVGVGRGTDLGRLGQGAAILVVASDLEEEAPLWWMRVKRAADRGATLIVLGARHTKLHRYADHAIWYNYGDEVATLNAMLGAIEPTPGRDVEGLEEALNDARRYQADEALHAAALAFAGAQDAVVICGGEGLNAARGRELARAAANLLIATGHAGRAGNGLLMVWPAANTQGAFDMGVCPDFLPGYQPAEQSGLDYDGILQAARTRQIRALYIAGANPAYDQPFAAEAITAAEFVIVQDMFLTDTARLADVVLPVQSVAEREGTYTNGERHVQRFYPALAPFGQSLPDWQIFGRVGERLGLDGPAISPAALMLEIAENVPQYAGITYRKLAEVHEQWPAVGGHDLYYGGTSYNNTSGLGVQWASLAEDPNAPLSLAPADAGRPPSPGKGQVLLVPVRRLYDREAAFYKTELLHQRVPAPYVALNQADAERLGVTDGGRVRVGLNGYTLDATVTILPDADVPAGVALLAARLQPGGWPDGAISVTISKVER
jgi:NADH-quinone oxidoreductase subunit G